MNEAAPLPEAAVVAERLTKRYGSLTAVEDLSFSVAPGEIVGFLGPNGAGKSTTLRILAGTMSGTSGRAAIWGAFRLVPHDPCTSTARYHVRGLWTHAKSYDDDCLVW